MYVNGHQSHVLISHAAFHQMVPFTRVQQVKFEVISHIHKNVLVYPNLFQAFGYEGHTPNNNFI